MDFSRKCSEIGFFPGKAVFAALQNSIAFCQEIGHGVEDAGCIAAVDYLERRISVLIPANVQKTAGSNQGGQHGRIIKNIRIIQPEDFRNLHGIMVEAVGNDAVSEGIDSSGAPAERIGKSPEFRRNEGVSFRNTDSAAGHGELWKTIFPAGSSGRNKS